jgi:hypothetical protein
MKFPFQGERWPTTERKIRESHARHGSAGHALLDQITIIRKALSTMDQAVSQSGTHLNGKVYRIGSYKCLSV